MKKRRKIFRTPEEYEAWKAEGDRWQRLLRKRMRMIEAEFASRGQKLE